MYRVVSLAYTASALRDMVLMFSLLAAVTKEEEGHWRGKIDIPVSLLMIIVGTLLSIPPSIPRSLVSLAGLGLIAGRLRAVTVFLDRAGCRVRRAYKTITG